MKRFLIVPAFLIIIATSCNQNAEVKTYTDTLSYAMGKNLAINIEKGIESKRSDSMNIDVFIAAVKDYFANDTSIMTKDELKIFLNAYSMKKQQEMQEERIKQQKEQEEKDRVTYKDNIEEGEKFLKENAKKEGVVTTESGLQYKILKAGTGDMPKPADRVKVHYTGKLLNDTVFDSSVERGEPASFGVTQVIRGWTEALQLMKEGAKYELYIPYDLAYGSRAQGAQIKPFSTLIFEVELISIETKDK